MKNQTSTFSFTGKASYPKNAVALLYDLEGFSRFFNQPDVQDYVPTFLNYVSEAVGVNLFGGEAYWANDATIIPLELEVAQRRKIGLISAVARHRHMYPIDAPLDTCGDRVGNLNQVRGVLRLLKVLVSKVAITEVIA